MSVRNSRLSRAYAFLYCGVYDSGSKVYNLELEV